MGEEREEAKAWELALANTYYYAYTILISAYSVVTVLDLVGSLRYAEVCGILYFSLFWLYFIANII